MKPNADYAKLWQPNRLGVELYAAQFFHHQFGKHFHETYTIGLNDGGQGRFLHRGAAHCAPAGSFNLINPGEVHTGQPASASGWAFRNLYISEALVRQLLPQLEWRGEKLPAFAAPVLRHPPLRSVFNQLFEALSAPAPQLGQQSLLLELLAALFDRAAPPHSPLRSPRSEPEAVTVIRDYLETHYAENVSIEALSQLVGLSPYYLIRSFRQQVGLPPHRYQHHWQLLQAKRSLRTAQPLSDIAAQHGFYDQSHLNRSFKRAFGVTPGQYRQGNSVQYSAAPAPVI